MATLLSDADGFATAGSVSEKGTMSGTMCALGSSGEQLRRQLLLMVKLDV